MRRTKPFVKGLMCCVVVLGFVTPALGQDSSETLTQFENGQVADAAAINANFTALQSAISNVSVEPAVVEDNGVMNCDRFVVPYMPYGSTASQIISFTRFPETWFGNVSNVGSSGQIYLEAITEEGVVTDAAELLTLDVGITKLSQVTYEKLLEAGFDGSGKVALSFNVGYPGNVSLFAAYNAGGDRLAVPVQCLRATSSTSVTLSVASWDDAPLIDGDVSAYFDIVPENVNAYGSCGAYFSTCDIEITGVPNHTQCEVSVTTTSSTWAGSFYKTVSKVVLDNVDLLESQDTLSVDITCPVIE